MVTEFGLVEKVMLGTALLGAAAGPIGAFAVLRKQALVGDMLAHAALPGVCIAYALTQSRSLLGLSFGALISGLLGIATMTLLTKWTRTKKDAAIGIVLSTFFGVGVVCLSLLQKSGSHSGLDTYLFGQTAGMRDRDIVGLTITLLVCLGMITLLYKEFKLSSFDPHFAGTLGWPVGKLDVMLLAILAGVTIIGLPIVGVILMASLIIIPGTAARFWTDRLGIVLILAGVFGATAGLSGTLLSSRLPAEWLGFDPLRFGNGSNLPPGPLIVLSAASLFAVSMLFAPSQGVLARAFREISLRWSIAREHLLRSLYEQSEPHLPTRPVIAQADILSSRSWSQGILLLLIHWLSRNGLIDQVKGKGLRLTERGLAEAEQVTRAHRLWETFLVQRAHIAPDHVDRDADLVEHLLPEQLIEKLESQLAEGPGQMPPSPHDLESSPTDIGHT